MELVYDVNDSLRKYFHTLSSVGYKGYSDVYRLLVYIFLEGILNNMGMYITEKDYSDIDKALYCLYGTSCAIPYPDYKRTFHVPRNKVLSKYRISENNILRSTEEMNIRT